MKVDICSNWFTFQEEPELSPAVVKLALQRSPEHSQTRIVWGNTWNLNKNMALGKITGCFGRTVIWSHTWTQWRQHSKFKCDTKIVGDKFGLLVFCVSSDNWQTHIVWENTESMNMMDGKNWPFPGLPICSRTWTRNCRHSQHTLWASGCPGPMSLQSFQHQSEHSDALMRLLLNNISRMQLMPTLQDGTAVVRRWTEFLLSWFSLWTGAFRSRQGGAGVALKVLLPYKSFSIFPS